MKVSPEDVRTPWTHGAGSAPARRRVSWRAGRCRGAPGPTELSAPRPVALATTSITGSLVFGGEKRGAKLGQDESSSSDALEQDETGFGCDGAASDGLRCTSGVSLHLPLSFPKQVDSTLPTQVASAPCTRPLPAARAMHRLLTPSDPPPDLVAASYQVNLRAQQEKNSSVENSAC